MFRRWRVRHSYPKPVVELVVRLIPIHGATALSRLLDIPTSVIYRWRAKHRVCVALPGNTTSDAQTLAMLAAQCEELGFRTGYARATNGRAGAAIDARPCKPAASPGNSLHDTAGDVVNPLLRMGSDSRDGQGGGPDTQLFNDAADALRASRPPVRSHAARQHYVFDACRERPVRGVRSRMEAVR
jgi:hypothetical protein